VGCDKRNPSSYRYKGKENNMNIIEHVKFRWRNNRAPLPGEIAPTDYGAVIIWMSKDKEAEQSLILRKLRGLITGYGEGGTFRAALWSWLWPKLLVVFYVMFLILLFLVRCAL